MSEYRELRNQGGLTFGCWGLIFIVLLVVGTIVFGLLRPLVLDFQTRANQNSQGYVEAKQRLLIDLVEEYTDLEVKITEAETAENTDLVSAYEANQNAILDQIWTESETIDGDQIPDSVAQFLANHPE